MLKVALTHDSNGHKRECLELDLTFDKTPEVKNFINLDQEQSCLANTCQPICKYDHVWVPSYHCLVVPLNQEHDRQSEANGKNQDELLTSQSILGWHEAQTLDELTRHNDHGHKLKIGVDRLFLRLEPILLLLTFTENSTKYGKPCF